MRDSTASRTSSDAADNALGVEGGPSPRSLAADALATAGKVAGSTDASSPATATPRVVYDDNLDGIALLQANCLGVLDDLALKHPDGCFDMVFVDPPYFLSNGGITCHAGRMVKVDKGEWDRSLGPGMNHEFNTAWLSRCQRVLKPNGTIWITGTHHVIFSVGFALQQLGFKILNDITWEKPNPPPNLSCRYFTHSTETVLWATRSDRSRHFFNYRLMRELNAGKQMKTVWRIGPPVKDEKKFGKHPTQKPVALVERCLQAATKEGDLVLDPFMGAGTSAVACARLSRRFLGIELDETFAQTAAKRVRQEAKREGRAT
jgi:site-specific DNA-methyltransferase (adenine-specific)